MNMSSSEDYFNIKLVREIEKYPLLYDFNHAEYSKRDACDETWEKVAKVMNDTAANCKSRWRNIRTVFVRKLKNGTVPKSRKKQYYLMESLQFLAPFVKGSNVKPEEVYGNIVLKNEETNSNSNQEEYENMDDNQSEASLLNSEDFTFADREAELEFEKQTSVPQKNSSGIEKRNKRRISTYSLGEEDVVTSRKRTCYEEESRKMFLLSLLADVQKLSDSKMRTFRRGVLELLDSLFVEHEKSFIAEHVSSEMILPKIEPFSVE